MSLHAYSMELYGNTQKEEVVSHEMLYFLYIQKVKLHHTELPKRNYIKMILLKNPKRNYIKMILLKNPE